MSDDLVALFRQTGALLDGHFVLRSGLHVRSHGGNVAAIAVIVDRVAGNGLTLAVRLSA